jgi:hypothetical protein
MMRELSIALVWITFAMVVGSLVGSGIKKLRRGED